MFERFNEQGRQVVVLAQDEARSLGHDHIGSRALLLGLLRLDDELVELLGEPDDVRRRVVELVGEGEAAAPGRCRSRPNGKAALERAAAEPPTSTIGPWQHRPRAARARPRTRPRCARCGALGVEHSQARETDPRPADDELARRTRSLAASAPRRAACSRPLRATPRTPRSGPSTCCSGSCSRCPSSRAPHRHRRRRGRARAARRAARRSRAVAPRRRRAATSRCSRRRSANAAQAAQGGRHRPRLMLGLLEVAPDVVARAAVDLAAMEAHAVLRLPWQGRAADDEPPSCPMLASVFSRRRARRDRARALEEARAARPRLRRDRAPAARPGPGRAGRRRTRAGRPARRGSPRRASRSSTSSARGDERHVAGAAACRSPLARSASSAAALREMRARALPRSTPATSCSAIERDGEGVAVQVLERLGASGWLVRRRTLALRGDTTRGDPPARLAAERTARAVRSPRPRRARSATPGSAASTCCSRSLRQDGPAAGRARRARGDARLRCIAGSSISAAATASASPSPHASCVPLDRDGRGARAAAQAARRPTTATAARARARERRARTHAARAGRPTRRSARPSGADAGGQLRAFCCAYSLK